ncbi:AAA family ATPase [Pendulispora albinea]|uniref:AAA family ATPase n=1 Tax=Pendulispora albinea TaxID=2741071 RepID=A0ABZ2MB53_9BACT
MPSENDSQGFILRVQVLRDRIPDASTYPFSIPALAGLTSLELHPQVTYVVGENGSGKSTLLEGIAAAAGFNPEGGSPNFQFSTRSSESPLHHALRLVRSSRRPRTGFFLRAESFFNLATNIEELDRVQASAPPIINSYGRRSLHEQSHGESFIALATRRFGAQGLYILDEPEAALSPLRQLGMLSRMQELVERGSQFIIATHAPLLLAYPSAWIYELSEEGIRRTSYDETGTVRVTRDFLADPNGTLRKLLKSPPRG